MTGPLRPLTARSTVLSVLLGIDPPELPVRDLVRIVEPFGVAAATARVALSRMVAGGDLVTAGGTYRIGPRLAERKARQDDAVRAATVPWHGDWEVVVITAVGRDPADRAALRLRLVALHLAELREGVWMRPANLRRTWPPDPDGLLRRFVARPDDDPHALTAQLWDLHSWAATASTLLGLLCSAGDPQLRFTAAAASVRHLLTDPRLPAELQPDGWPGGTLRAAYVGYQRETSPGRGAG
jgi:phenylacetic acid degradation operon negative regulatory protein